MNIKSLKHQYYILSYYLKSNQQQYYKHLQAFRMGKEGVIKWVYFFLEALQISADDAFNKAVKLKKLIKKDEVNIAEKGSSYS